MNKAECPSCGVEIKMSAHPKMGQRIVCRLCRAPLVVAWLSPLELDWVDAAEDDDDEEEESGHDRRYRKAWRARRQFKESDDALL